MEAYEDVARVIRRVRRDGVRETARRAVRVAYRRIDAAALDFPLLPGDVADSTRLAPGPTPARRTGSGPLTVGWLCTPPSAGSGGHTTMFRMIESLEQAGHRCVLFLYDRHGGDVRAQETVIRGAWPAVRAEVRDVHDGLTGVDACVATGWPTAHVLAMRGTAPMHRLYFIQDFEPFFYARGSEYALAADSYRLGFHNIALGHMVQDRLRCELGVDAMLVPFSCDTTVYRLTNRGPRSGIVFYTKPDVPRRGYRLGALALEDFHRRHPDQEIHVYGDLVPDIRVPVTRHQRLTPVGLNALYNQVLGGLAMSFTNISLVAEEMLAAGVIPVVNDSPDSRVDLENPLAVWAPPTSGGISDALASVVTHPDPSTRAADAAGSVRTDDWQGSGRILVEILERVNGLA